MAEPHGRAPDLDWARWGRPERREHLSAALVELLQQALGLRGPAPAVVEAADVQVPASRLTPPAHHDLAAVVGAVHVKDDPAARLSRAAGRSTADLLGMRAGTLDGVPDAVVLPGSHDEVQRLLTVCTAHRIAVVPFGGGTSVVGGVAARAGEHAAVVALDVRRLGALVSLDRESGLATLQTGLRAPEAEALLGVEGFTLGHFPQSYEYASLGGFAATRSAGQASSGYGRFDEMVVALRVATPAGSLRVGRVVASAAGPDLRQLFLGSEGALGVITELTLRVRPEPEVVVDEAWAFADFAAGVAALRKLAVAGEPVTVTRLSDEAETWVNSQLAPASPGAPAAAHGAEGCRAVIAHEGPADLVEARGRLVAALLQRAGGRRLAQPRAGEWRAVRFRAPYLRDALLDAGVFVETLETAGSWSQLARLRDGVTTAVVGALTTAGRPPVIMCHVSHVYRTGASLYFTVVCRIGPRPREAWAAAKRAAGDAIIAAGGTITHHHGVGTEHLPWMAAEVGPLGLDVLRAVKTTLDPAGILNPGKLIPPLD
ncbi:MAG TPA: FAD-binding oxidoreductase [Nocardioidaceae bacterium]|nr:FAD-binding oxidoreductase [Nocardioidaceae bacterium]